MTEAPGTIGAFYAEIIECLEEAAATMGEQALFYGDLGHYFRFEQLACGRSYLPSDDAGAPSGPEFDVDWTAVYPMIANPRGDDYADPELRAASDAVNRTWSGLLRQLEAAFNGFPEALLTAVPAMFSLRDQALVLLANPLPCGGGRHAGPAFEWTADR